MDPDSRPQQLQNKVQFDIRYYMLRCKAENVDKMTKNTFKLQYDDESGIPIKSRGWKNKESLWD